MRPAADSKRGSVLELGGARRMDRGRWRSPMRAMTDALTTADAAPRATTARRRRGRLLAWSWWSALLVVVLIPEIALLIVGHLPPREPPLREHRGRQWVRRPARGPAARGRARARDDRRAGPRPEQALAAAPAALSRDGGAWPRLAIPGREPPGRHRISRGAMRRGSAGLRPPPSRCASMPRRRARLPPALVDGSRHGPGPSAPGGVLSEPALRRAGRPRRPHADRERAPHRRHRLQHLRRRSPAFVDAHHHPLRSAALEAGGRASPSRWRRWW